MPTRLRPAASRLRTRLAIAGLAVACSAAPGVGQDLRQLRDLLREDLQDIHFARSLTGLVLLADEFELSGARYRLDDANDTELWSVTLPWTQVFRPFGHDAPGLYVEAVAGFARATQRTDDLYGGVVPPLRTAVRAEWVTWGALLGAGPEFRLAEGLTLTAILDGGISHIDNEAEFAGPGAAFTAALTNGIAFNWEALALVGGGAARLDYTHRLGDGRRLEVVARYDLRWTETIREDDPAQDFATRSQLLSLQAEMTGPIGWELFGGPLGWRASTVYRRFVEGDLFGVRDLFQVGGSLEFDVSEFLPLGRGLTVGGAVIFGEDTLGWTFGLGVTF